MTTYSKNICMVPALTVSGSVVVCIIPAIIIFIISIIISVIIITPPGRA